MTRLGVTRRDLGRLLSWPDFRDFLSWLPPTGESAWFRARKPNSWWVTPQMQIMAGLLYAVEGGNWQRGGGQGDAPKPMEFPSDGNPRGPRDADDLAARREAIRRRRRRSG